MEPHVSIMSIVKPKMASQEPTPQAPSATLGEISPHFDELLRDVTDALTAEELKDVVASIKNTLEVNSQAKTDQDLYSHLRLFATQKILSEENLTLLERFVACKSSKKEGITKRIEKFKKNHLQSGEPKVSGQAIKGRDLDLNLIMAKLTGAKEIVNLYGSGGVGKTTLGKEISLRWPGQSIFVDMREVAEMKDVYFQIMMALDTKRTVLTYDENPVINQLRKLRKESPGDVLLLLDNVDNFSGGNDDLSKTLNDKMVKLLQTLIKDKDRNAKDDEGIARLKVALISRTRFQGLTPCESDCYEVKALEKGFSQELILQKAGELSVLQMGKLEKIVDMCKGYPLLLNGMAATLRQKIAAGEKFLRMVEDELTTSETDEGETFLSPVQNQQEREAWQSLSKEIGEGKLSCLRKMFFFLPTINLRSSAVALSLFCYPFSEEAAASVLGVESSEAVIVLEGLRSSEVLSVDPDVKELLYDIHPLMRSFLRSIGNTGSPVFRKACDAAKDRFLCYEEALELSKKLKRSGILRLALLQRNFANAHAWKREFEKAYKPAMDALEIRREILGDHPDTARSAFQVGEICKGKGQFDEAEEFLEEAWRIEKSLEMGNHSAVRDRIIRSYEGVLENDRKKEFRKEALEFYVGLWQEDKEFSYAKKSIIDQIIERLNRFGDRKMMSKYRTEALEFYVMAWNSPDLQQLPQNQREEILQIILNLSEKLHEKELHRKFQGENFEFFEKQWEERTIMTVQDEKDILRTLQGLATQLGDEGKSEKYKKLYEVRNEESYVFRK